MRREEIKKETIAGSARTRGVVKQNLRNETKQFCECITTAGFRLVL